LEGGISSTTGGPARARAHLARALAAAVLAATVAPGVPVSQAAGTDEGAGRERLFSAPPPGSYELPVIRRVRDRALLDPEGRPAPLLGLADGQVAFVSFVYRSCADAAACPLAVSVFKRLDGELARHAGLAGRVRLVTVSFDPAHDTPRGMAALRARLAPASDWRFLTAPDRGAIDPVLADFGQEIAWSAAARGEEAIASHLLRVYLVDASGAVRNVYGADLLDAELLRNDAATVLGLGADGLVRTSVSAAP
jgi:cytochrome oxidase Cu insertion factor (SCO1/SenC/PrrC family)